MLIWKLGFQISPASKLLKKVAGMEVVMGMLAVGFLRGARGVEAAN